MLNEPSGGVTQGDSRPVVSAIIITFNSAGWIGRCLRSIESTATVPIEIVVVDNASDDDSLAEIAQHDSVQRVESTVNLGFAKAVNVGARRARGDYLLLLNPDAELHPGTLEALHRFSIENPQCGIVGGRAFSPEGVSIPGTAYGAPSLWSAFCFAIGMNRLFRGSHVFDPESLGGWERDSVQEVDIVTGCVMMIRRDVWEQLGGFDESFFMYSEDADLSARAIARGYRPAITPSATVTHAVAASSPSSAHRWVLMLAGRATYYAKHRSAIPAWIAQSMLLLGVVLRTAIRRALRIRRPGHFHGDSWGTVLKRRQEWVRGYEQHRP